MFLVAARAVATSPPMPQYARYVEAVEGTVFPGTQPEPDALRQGLVERARRHERIVPARLRGLRLTTALVSFVDDHRRPFPAECFHHPSVLAASEELLALEQATVLDLLDLPSVAGRGSFLDAVLTAHALVRQLARGRDGRALPGFTPDLAERLSTGRRILPFPTSLSQGGDPLGDTYHYLATLAAGLAGTSAVRRSWMLALFAAGPELMAGVREGVFGGVLFYGNHARIDRLGLRHGMSIGRGAA